MNFTHLHVHTEYSLLDGASKIREMVAAAKKLGMDSLAITDHGVMYGVIDFYRACKDEGIRPILGSEIYVAPGSRFDKEGQATDDRYNHLVLLAENDVGYHNLMKIVSIGFTEGFYYRPRVDYEVLKEYREGIIALSACLAGEVSMKLRRGSYEEAKKSAIRLRDIFGEGNFFLELQDHGIREQQSVNQGLLRIHDETGIPLVATNDIHYTYAEDAEAHDILLCIQTQKKVDDEDRMRYEGGQYYMKSPQEMYALFPYAKEALENTYKIARRCEVSIEFGKYKLPRYDVPEGYTSVEYLRTLCEDGLKKKYGDPDESLKERLRYELDTIGSMGFADYFLVVWDFIKYAKDNGIAVGPGRGSVGGSMVSYTLDITEIDPIKYGLVFERFLNPERMTMPDIDIDFCYERRQEVIDYVMGKYGHDKVVQIITFGTMAARAVIRDVGRALDMPYGQVDIVAKMIPFELNITIANALKRNNELNNLYQADPVITRLIDMSRRLEGLPRHASVHAAGVVISDAPVSEYVPLSKSADDNVTTQFTMVTLEELGLLKMDFLGLRTLTVIQNTINIINNRGGTLDIDKIDYNDKNIYDLISTGRTDGIFQLESAGMRNFMKELKPRGIEDIIAGISLYRPGPMAFIPQYVRWRHNQNDIKYKCPELEPILKTTYGCIVYQEQVMQIVRDLAGYSYGRSDLVRRAMSKKKHDVMVKERNNFVYGNDAEGVEGCVRRGIDVGIANQIFDEMVDFANYAFPRGHAAGYAIIACQTAYLRHYYPIEYMAALMTSVIGFAGKVTEYIMTCRQMGIEVRPPDVNEGNADFGVDGRIIRYGMSAIKGLGHSIIDAVVAERVGNGRYKSMTDFIRRLSSKEVNKRTMESFIKSGAFDSLPGNRRQKMLSYVGLLDEFAQQRKKQFDGQISLFDFGSEEEKEELEQKYPDVAEYDKEQLLAFEKEMLGIYVSGHPLDDYIDLLKKNVTSNTSDFVTDDETGQATIEDGSFQVIGGMVIDRTLKSTKSNTVMAFITLEDLYGTVEVIVFPREFERYRPLVELESKIFIKGRVSAEEEKAAKLICQEIIPFLGRTRELWVKYDCKEDFDNDEQKLYNVIGNYDGNDTVVIYCEKEKNYKRLPYSRNVGIDDRLLGILHERYGEKNIRVVEKKV